MANVKNFGAVGDGKTDDTAAFEHALKMGDGLLEVPRGDYILSRPLVVPLDRVGRFSIYGSGGQARLTMKGAGPALHLVGTHHRTSGPSEFREAVWQLERFPTIAHIEIVGDHAEADGVRIEGTMQSTITHVLIRRCRYGVHLVKRARNVILDGCHIYHCRRIGVYFDRVNLHQTNIYGCHISYNPQGGIVIQGGEVRNLQICGNDIEYNHDEKADTSADVLFDAREGTIREGTIVGNTIQARESPAGANLRLVGVGQGQANAVGVLTISGNLLGSQETVLHLVASRGITITGNAIYSGYGYALRAQDCVNIVFSGNSLDYNSDYKGNSTDAVLWERCSQISLQGNVQVHTLPGKLDVPASWVFRHCREVMVQGCQVIAPRRRGIYLEDCDRVLISGCHIGPGQGGENYMSAVWADDKCRAVFVTHNMLTKGREGEVVLPGGSGQASGNFILS
ncbi:MAG: right-handed parallel beta-helix repeat-containing protein [Gemmatales bacterium]|nr:right-handed parallel beta-helix repeat-containing protein [Gemmatales bacterium]MCS7160133.1 right-handed parallel beta-helix repeat-containing protein [Gemmatales bacterium]MDW8175333.1 right-handed parallel beta-helix repeat-containing protein [Gemmatales bacterium]MDW8221787.1 right-handed parallel beta-helix repeat-containing protein [Gemmatales bacterium]